MATLIAGTQLVNEVPDSAATPDVGPGLDLQDFINALNGVCYTCPGYTAYPCCQCVDLACAWARNLGLPVPCSSPCNGDDFIGGTYAGWTWIANTATNIPSPGDLVAYHGTCDGIGSAGHVDIFVSGNASSFTSFAQNWGGCYCHLVTHDYACVAGWQHPVAPLPSPSPSVSPSPSPSFPLPMPSPSPIPAGPMASEDAAILLLGAGVLAGIAYLSPGIRRQLAGLPRRLGLS